MIDTQMPVVTAPECYWNNNYPYTLSGHDQIGLAGVRTLWYRVDVQAVNTVVNEQPLGTTAPLTASFDLAGGTGTPHTVYYLAQDYAGNLSSGVMAKYATRMLVKSDISSRYGWATSYVVIDRTPPTVKARGVNKSWRNRAAVVRFSAKDGLAGVGSIQYSITSVKAKKAGGWTTGTSAVVTSTGKHKVWYRAIDAAQPVGNASRARYVVVKIRP
jgi:hypothetical protein